MLYLKSSNTGNNAFYRPRGIETVGTYYLGGDNPKWAGAPIPIQIVSCWVGDGAECLFFVFCLLRWLENLDGRAV